MTSSASSSSRAAARTLLLVLSLALACAAPASSTGRAAVHEAGAPADPSAPRGSTRLAVFPLENLSGGLAPTRQLHAALSAALRSRGFELVGEAEVQSFLAAHRIRYTAGIAARDAKAAGAELGVGAVLVGAVELFATDRLTLSARLVSADERAAVLWADAASKVADDSPGLLGLGIVRDEQGIRDIVMRRLTSSLEAALRGGARASACSGGSDFAPRVHYRAPHAGAGPSRSVVVLPFRNRSGNRGASDRISLEFVRQLAANSELAVVEPGALRDMLLRFRIVLQGGIGLDDVRNILGSLDADLIVTGTVFDFADSRGGAAPRINFTAMLIDARSDEIIWSSTSYNQGTDAVVLFDFGNVPTAQGLGCRMVRGVVDGMLQKLTFTPRVSPARP